MSLRKIRTYRSCQSCRLSKTKCNGDRPKCARCAAKLIQCVYDGGAAPRWTRNLNRSQATSVDDDAGSSSPTEQDAMMGVAPSEVDETASLRGSVSKVSDEANDKSSIIASESAGVSVTGAASQHGSNEQLSSHPLAWYEACNKRLPSTLLTCLLVCPGYCRQLYRRLGISAELLSSTSRMSILSGALPLCISRRLCGSWIRASPPMTSRHFCTSSVHMVQSRFFLCVKSHIESLF